MQIKKTFIGLIEKLDRVGHMAVWAVFSVALLLLVAPLNPMLIGSYLWVLCKLSGAASLGYGFDWAAFRGQAPADAVEALEKTMYAGRRATIMAATVIGAGLIG